MKKLLMLLLLLLCLPGLCACGKEEEAPALPNPEDLQILKDRALPDLSREESLRMLCYMSANRALLSGERLYTLDYDGDYLPVLAEYSLTDGLRRNAILAEDCVPEYLCLYQEQLYYINARRGDVLERVALDGSERELLREEPCTCLLIEDGRLLYCDEAGALYSAAPDGSGERRLPGPACARPWPLGEAQLQESLEDGRLHLYWPEDGTDVTLTEHAGCCPVIWEGRLYYSSEEHLRSMGLNGLGAVCYEVPALAWPAELLPMDAGLRLRGITDDNGYKQWTAEAEDPAGTLQYLSDHGYRLCDYVGPEGRVDTIYNLDGRVRCFLLTDAAGQEHVYIAGRVSG